MANENLGLGYRFIAAKIVDIEKMMAVLRKKAAEARIDTDVSVVVGYTAAYALYVHENLQGTPHPPKSDAQRKAMFASIRERERRGRVSWSNGQPKFLTMPFRELGSSGEFRRIIIAAIRAGKTFAQGLLLAGLRLQRESQKLVPVDTGNLKSSAFTTLE